MYTGTTGGYIGIQYCECNLCKCCGKPKRPSIAPFRPTDYRTLC